MSTGVNMGRHGTLAYWLVHMLSFVTGNLDRRGGNILSVGFYRSAKAGKRVYEQGDSDSEFGAVRRGSLPGTLLADHVLDAEQPVKALICVAGNPLLPLRVRSGSATPSHRSSCWCASTSTATPPATTPTGCCRRPTCSSGPTSTSPASASSTGRGSSGPTPWWSLSTSDGRSGGSSPSCRRRWASAARSTPRTPTPRCGPAPTTCSAAAGSVSMTCGRGPGVSCSRTAGSPAGSTTSTCRPATARSTAARRGSPPASIGSPRTLPPRHRRAGRRCG